MKKKMHNLPFDQQLDVLKQRAATRLIHANDRYLEVYPDLLNGVQALLPLNRQNLILTAHAVFGWMPTQLRVNMDKFGDALAILCGPKLASGALTEDDFTMLASTFKTANGISVVSASKILHFLAPEQYPIWDRLVAKTWGLPPSGPKAAESYHGFIKACHKFTNDPIGQEACNSLEQKLKTNGYNYPVTQMRLIELIFFLP